MSEPTDEVDIKPNKKLSSNVVLAVVFGLTAIVLGLWHLRPHRHRQLVYNNSSTFSAYNETDLFPWTPAG